MHAVQLICCFHTPVLVQFVACSLEQKLIWIELNDPQATGTPIPVPNVWLVPLTQAVTDVVRHTCLSPVQVELVDTDPVMVQNSY
jgi:hypothetical protein